MDVRFWGTRGSIPKPGPTTIRIGGNTSCVEVRSAAGTLIVIDCGTGAHGLGQSLVASSIRRGHMLIGHTHWDHIQGLPFFAPFFVPGSEWDIYGPKGLGGSLRNALAGQMESTYFPISLDQFGATIRYHDLVEGRFEIDDVRVRTRYLNHPALTLAYRLDADGESVVYACDHEPFSREAALHGALSRRDLEHAAFASGASLLIHDSQYTADEYPAKVRWGHSTIEYAVSVAQSAGVRQLALTHHDPLRTDDQIDRIVKDVRSNLTAVAAPLEVLAAFEGLTIVPSRHQTTRTDIPEPVVTLSALTDHSVLLSIFDAGVSERLAAAARAEGLDVTFETATGSVLRSIDEQKPSLVMLEHERTGHDALAVCRSIRARLGEQEAPLPVIVVADKEVAGGDEAGVSDWLIKPFSDIYARVKMEGWVLRGVGRWRKAPVPDDEEQRLAALYAMHILDTANERRYDRVTRVAARLFDVPMSFITLVDRDRQWFKSCVGLDIQETPRDLSFCAHVVYGREPLVVNDTLLDDRFADNPAVTGGPRIRFYAGAPLILDDGAAIGTLCLLDTRPRSLSEADLGLLGDLRDLAVAELQRPIR